MQTIIKLTFMQTFLTFLLIVACVIIYLGIFTVKQQTAAIVVVGNIYSIGFFKDIALALLLLSIVGTVGFSVVLKRGD